MPPVLHCLYAQGLCEALLGYQQPACCFGTGKPEPHWCLTCQLGLPVIVQAQLWLGNCDVIASHGVGGGAAVAHVGCL